MNEYASSSNCLMQIFEQPNINLNSKCDTYGANGNSTHQLHLGSFLIDYNHLQMAVLPARELRSLLKPIKMVNIACKF